MFRNARLDSRSRSGATLALAMAAILTWACGPREATPPAAEAPAPAPAAAAPSGATRMERDLLGELAVPAEAYYGVQTMRALENFKISGLPISHYPGFIEGLGHGEARRGAGQHRCRRDETGDPRGHRESRATRS